MANVAAADAAVEDQKRKEQVATGASELLHHRNPFYVTAGRGLFVTIAAFAIAFFGYWLCIYWISTSLVRSVERADPMLEVLRGSSTYTLSNPSLDKAENAPVDDLAIATWIKHYKLVSPDTELVDVLGEPRFELLRAALRYGGHCPAPTGEVLPLRMPVVQRIVALAAFLAGGDCGTASGRGPELASIAIVVRNISAMPVGRLQLDASGTAVEMLCGFGHPISLDNFHFVGARIGERQSNAPIGCPALFSSTPQLSGKQVFKIILDRGGTFEHLDVKPPTTFANQRLVRSQAETALQAAKTALETKRNELAAKEASGDPAIQALKGELPGLEDTFNEAQLAYHKIVASTLSEEVKWHEQARAILYALNQGRVKGGATSLDDPQVQAIEDFAIALMASVDTDASVTGARQLLAAARGAEQFLIVALFMMVGALMLERVLAFRRRGWEIDRATSQIKIDVAASDADAEKARLEAEKAAGLAAGLTAPQPAASAAKPGDDLQDRRIQQTERASRLRATIATLNLHVGRGGQDRTSEVASDMVNAVLNDLSQTSLYGLSDERTDKVAEDLKVKVDSSRQLIGWGITTLPALGFLGTVHGILNALNGVSGLTQGDAAARLATLLNVSGALGLAFSTTLIALIGMMILTFFDIVQARSEKSMIEEFRDFLNDRVLA
ncbi:MotA/TolQ/ExbB proton channel family protein [Rhizobium johnstonii]|uniref:MotA/TolQ/ExbB proton channel family protein n=1 Tax=Rhizobium johnstonii TaxID=3019933 RepID=UPI003F9B76FF